MAWDVGNGKKGGANVRGIAISIGDFAPSFDDMWLSHSKFIEKEQHKLYTKGILKPNTKDARFIAIQKTNQLENAIYLDQPTVHIYYQMIETKELANKRYNTTIFSNFQILLCITTYIDANFITYRLVSSRPICRYRTEKFITIGCQFQSSRQTLMSGDGKNGINLNQQKLKT